jgi:hypothetical protein
MNFQELNPLLSGASTFKQLKDAHELTFTCPICKNKMSIYVYLNKPHSQQFNIWNLKIATGWETASIEPSIKGHHIKRTPQGDIRCPVHINVTDGQINNA